jgi:hypothetical protein
MALVAVWRLDDHDGISFKKTFIKASLIMFVNNWKLFFASSGLKRQTMT